MIHRIAWPFYICKEKKPILKPISYSIIWFSNTRSIFSTCVMCKQHNTQYTYYKVGDKDIICVTASLRHQPRWEAKRKKWMGISMKWVDGTSYLYYKKRKEYVRSYMYTTVKPSSRIKPTFSIIILQSNLIIVHNLNLILIY